MQRAEQRTGPPLAHWAGQAVCPGARAPYRAEDDVLGRCAARSLRRRRHRRQQQQRRHDGRGR